MANFRWFNDREVRDARRAFDDAQDRLEDYGRHMDARKDPTETGEYHRLNDAVHEARQNLRNARP